MKRQLYIVGTSHSLQCGAPDRSSSSIAGLTEELQQICERFKIHRVAEEMSQDGRSRYGVRETIAEKVAKSRHLAYHCVDLSAEERRDLSLHDDAVGISALTLGFTDGGGAFREAFDRIVDDVRERCWIARILARVEWPALFVCGAKHVNGIHKLWRSMKTQAVIVHADYQP